MNKRNILIFSFGIFIILIGRIVYIDSHEDEIEFNNKLKFFSDEGYKLNETDYWRQKANIMNSVTYVRVDFETLTTMASQLQDDSGVCIVSYDSEESNIWVCDIKFTNSDNYVYYWQQQFYKLADSN